MYTGGLPLAPEKTTLTFATHQGVGGGMVPPSNDVPIYAAMEEMTNVHIEWETYPTDQYGTMLQLRLSSSDKLPDIINLTLGNLKSFADEDIIIPLTKLIETDGPHTTRYMKENPSYRTLMTDVDNEIYAICNTVIADCLPLNYMANIYAMERVGVKDMPQTLDEFYDLLVKFRDAGMIALHDGFTRITGHSSTSHYLGNAFDLQTVWDGYASIVNDKAILHFEHPNFKDYLSFVNKLYAEDLLIKDFTTSGYYDVLVQRITSGDVGVAGYWATYAYMFGDMSPDSDPFKDKGISGEDIPIYEPMPPVKSLSGKQYFVKRLGGAGGDPMTITSDCAEEKRPVAMRWIDWLFNGPEALEMQYNGVEGLTYEKNSDGTITRLEAPDGKLWTTWLTDIGGNQPPRAHQQLVEGWRMAWMPDWMNDNYLAHLKYYIDPDILPIAFTPDETEEYSRIQADLDPFIDENIVQFVIGEKPLSGFDAFVTELKSRYGGDKLMELYQARYERQLAAQGR